RFDTFSFDGTRLVNALIDYGRYKKTKQRVQKLFMKNPYSLSLITTGKSNGILEVLPNVTQTFSLDLSDFKGNKTKVSVPVQYSSMPAEIAEVPKVSKYLVKAKRDNIFSKGNVTVSFPANTFLDDFYLNFDVTKGVLKLHEDIEPAFKSFSMTFKDSLSLPKDREKMFIGLADGNKIHFYETKKQKNSFTAYSKVLGEYRLLKDTIAPRISIAKSVEGRWISGQSELQFNISDDLSGIKSYEGFLNGNWMLLEFDRKTKKLIHRFSDGIVAEGRNDLKITVTDNVGNSAIFETHFFRSQEP
ncbi:MAG: M23 family peptidase, partial [Flavobacterium sp.]